MYKFPVMFVAITSLLLCNGCDEEKDDDFGPTTGTVYFNFNNVVDGVPVQPLNLNYTNDAGNNYSVNLLKYYISNIVFIKSDGTEFRAPNYELIDEDSASSKKFMVNLPFGDYTGLRFLMGVDSAKNFSGPQAGELDPIYGMLWDWNTGYLYFKHEGEFMDSTGVLQPIAYHYGGISALLNHEMNITLPVSGQPRIINITFNLNKIYRSPNVVDFNGNNLQSGAPGWIVTMKENFAGAFEVTGIY